MSLYDRRAAKPSKYQPDSVADGWEALDKLEDQRRGKPAEDSLRGKPGQNSKARGKQAYENADTGKTLTPAQINELADSIMEEDIYDGDEFTISENLWKVWGEFKRRIENEGYLLGMEDSDFTRDVKTPLADSMREGVKAHFKRKLLESLKDVPVLVSADWIETAVKDFKYDFEQAIEEHGLKALSIEVKEESNQIVYIALMPPEVTRTQAAELADAARAYLGRQMRSKYCSYGGDFLSEWDVEVDGSKGAFEVVAWMAPPGYD